MKKYILTAICALLPLLSTAQAQLQTKNFRISDICERTLEIVLTGDIMMDAEMREEIPNVWHISPYEFCTQKQFEERKRSEEYYFLTVTDSYFGRNSGSCIRSLTLFKGDPDAGEGTDGMYRITTIPFYGTDNVDGRHIAFLPALTGILQEQVKVILDKDFNIGDMVHVKPSNAMRAWSKPVMIAREDIAFPLDKSLKSRNIITTDAEQVEECIRTRDPRYMVGYSVGPATPSPDAVCFTMVIDAQSHELHYFHRRNVSATLQTGFDKADFRAINSHSGKR